MIVTHSQFRFVMRYFGVKELRGSNTGNEELETAAEKQNKILYAD
jgi:hypothetical protein